MTIERSEGITESERYLKNLCDHTFLSLWSYPGVYKDQFPSQGTDGKEVADLLVIFENHIIIFSDKDCQFPNTGKIDLDWNRWFKKAIQKSSDQLWGGQRWIKKYPHRLFLDRSCKSPFPLQIPDLSNVKFHLIVVAHDNTNRCKNELGGSGSLMINSSIKGDKHYIKEDNRFPFFVGDIDPSKSFVHILDDTSLDIVLNTLDTISDFVSYLTKKEKIFRSELSIIATGEEDLLAYYLTNINDNREHDFVIPSDVDKPIKDIYFDEGFWEEFCKSSLRQEQIKANKISYIWDELITIFSKHIMNETQYFTTHNNVKDIEPALRFLAKESRFGRRVLASALMGLIIEAPQNMRATCYVQSKSPQEPFYVFMTLPHFEYMSYDQYRFIRRELLYDCCKVVKLRFAEVHNIIGIATESGLNNGGRDRKSVV